jgi:hypothetical protein
MKKLFTAIAAMMVLFAGAAHAEVSLQEYDHLDPQNVVPDKPLRQAVTYFKLHKNLFSNKNYLVVIDYTQSAATKRMYVINMKTGAVERHLVAAGAGSDPNKDGRADRFGNSNRTHETSLGVFRTAEIYNGKHGRSLRLDGLSKTNSNARARAIVVHGAKYVDEDRDHTGRSWGCPAVDPDVINKLIGQVKGGAMIYAYGGQATI